MKVQTTFYYNLKKYLKTSAGWVKGDNLELVDTDTALQLESALNGLIYEIENGG